VLQDVGTSKDAATGSKLKKRGRPSKISSSPSDSHPALERVLGVYEFGAGEVFANFYKEGLLFGAASTWLLPSARSAGSRLTRSVLLCLLLDGALIQVREAKHDSSGEFTVMALLQYCPCFLNGP
jgi:hypothetical protein